MPRFARVAAVVALATALYCRAYAASAPIANLDGARMFNPASESLLANLFTPVRTLSPIAVALFHEPNAIDLPALPPPPETASGTGTVAAIDLQAYTAPVRLPSHPLDRPSITPVAPVQRAQLAQPHVRLETPQTQVRFGSYAPYAPALQSVSENVQVPVRIGGVRFSGLLSGAQAQTGGADSVRAMQLCGTTDEAAACPYLHDEHAQAFAAGTDFNVRAGNTQVNLQLSGTVSQITNRDAMYEYTPLDPDTNLDAVHAGTPADTSLLYYPGLTEVVRHGLNARVAVPVSPSVTLGLQYDTSHYQGNYGQLLAPGLDARKDTYLGNVTYQLPNSSSLLTLSARQYRYQDSFAPNFNLTETRADLSFTVKF